MTLFTVCCSQSKRELEYQIKAINDGRPQCPVGLNTLVLPSRSSSTIATSEKTPFVYLNCGHVHGQHGWGKDGDSERRTCPLCREVRHVLLLSGNYCYQTLKKNQLYGEGV